MESTIKVTEKNMVIEIIVTGKLDSNNAPELMKKLKEYIGKPITEIKFMAKDLEYIASSGLRVMIFSKQKIGIDTKIYLIGAQEAVLDVVNMSGLDNFLIIQN